MITKFAFLLAHIRYLQKFGGENLTTSTFEATHKRILECGKAQFLENGYEGTSLRELCKTVGITTESFYRHFTDKGALFSALVESTTSGLKDLLKDCLEKGYDLIAECPEIFYKEHYQHDIPTLLNYIYCHFDTFRLLALCGHKNCFRDFVRELAMLETKYAKRIAADLRATFPFPAEILLAIHQSFYIGLFEAVIHNVPKERMEELSGLLIQYYTASWSSVITEQGMTLIFYIPIQLAPTTLLSWFIKDANLVGQGATPFRLLFST